MTSPLIFWIVFRWSGELSRGTVQSDQTSKNMSIHCLSMNLLFIHFQQGRHWTAISNQISGLNKRDALRIPCYIARCTYAATHREETFWRVLFVKSQMKMRFRSRLVFSCCFMHFMVAISRTLSTTNWDVMCIRARARNIKTSPRTSSVLYGGLWRHACF